jgi:hypothetical protein
MFINPLLASWHPLKNYRFLLSVDNLESLEEGILDVTFSDSNNDYDSNT